MPLIIVSEPGTLGHYWEAVKTWVRRRLRSSIFAAIERGDEKTVLSLASPSRLQRAKNEYGNGPVVACMGSERFDLAIALIERGGYVPGDGAVAHAAMRKHLGVLKALVEAGADLNEPLPRPPSNHGWSPLMWATSRHNFEGMTLLLAAGANVNLVAEDGTTAVMCTSAGRDDDLVALEILCAHQPDLAQKDWRGRTIMDEARDRARFSKKTAMKEILQRHYPEVSNQ